MTKIIDQIEKLPQFTVCEGERIFIDYRNKELVIHDLLCVLKSDIVICSLPRYVDVFRIRKLKARMRKTYEDSCFTTINEINRLELIILDGFLNYSKAIFSRELIMYIISKFDYPSYDAMSNELIKKAGYFHSGVCDYWVWNRLNLLTVNELIEVHRICEYRHFECD